MEQEDASFVYRVKKFFNRIRWVVATIVCFYLVGATLFGVFERHHLGPGVFGVIDDAAWWATVTGFTVGYGDIYPETRPGRVVGHIYIVGMWLLLALLLALIVDAVKVFRDQFTHEEQEEMKSELDKIVEAVSTNMLTLEQLRGVIREELDSGKGTS